MPSVLPIPSFYSDDAVERLWRVDYQKRAEDGREWAQKWGIPPAQEDKYKIALMLVDVQNTFCLPEFELFVAGKSGRGAVEDNQRVCRFIYANLHRITRIIPTLDTHQTLQIFHNIFFVDEQGRHPDPYTLISPDDIRLGKWRFNPAAAESVNLSVEEAQAYLLHYTQSLAASGKYSLTIWPYHAMLGGIGHALVSAVEEAVFFHSVARYTQPEFQVKGNHPLTEHYSVLGPEVTTNHSGEVISPRNQALIRSLLSYDAVIIAGQAKSHCVAWTIDDLLREIKAGEPELARKVYLLEDCTSPVVIPGVIDYSEQADEAFARFAAAGMHVVRSDSPMSEWTDFPMP